MKLPRGMHRLLVRELVEDDNIVLQGFFNARGKLVWKRGKYEIDCRSGCPGNELLCIIMDSEVFELMFSADEIKPREVFRTVV